MQPIELSPNAQVTLIFILTDAGHPAAGQTVSFTTIGSSATGTQGASVAEPSATTVNEAGSPMLSTSAAGWPVMAGCTWSVTAFEVALNVVVGAFVVRRLGTCVVVVAAGIDVVVAPAHVVTVVHPANPSALALT